MGPASWRSFGLFVLGCRVMRAQKNQAQAGRPGEREHERGEQRGRHGEGERAEEAAGNSGDGDERKEDDDGRDGGADERRGDLVQRLAHRFDAAFAGFTMQDDVLDDDDGVVDDEADGGGETAERHEIEALAEQPHEEHGDRDRDRNDEARDDRRTPVAQEEEENHAGENEADEDGIAHAGDALAHQLRLVVKGLEVDARGKLLAQLIELGGDPIGNSDRVAGGLARNVEQHRRLSVGRDHGVDGHGRALDLRDIADAHRSAVGGGLDDEVAQAVEVMHLAAHQREDQLMVLLVEAGRVDDVGRVDGVGEVEDGDAGGLQLGEVGDDVELGNSAALHRNRAHAVDAIERRLQIIGGDLPQAASARPCSR